MLALDEEGLVVVKTKLGWTLQENRILVVGILGHKGPCGDKDKEAAEDEILKTFEETIKINEEKRYENTPGACAELLNRSWYVDNCLTSFDTEAETREFIQEAKQIMQAAKFNLRMWVTSPMKINEVGKDVISVLGINWDTVSDQLYCNTFNLPAINDIKRVTKRELLSLTQRVFDPIGYTSPVMLVPKLIMQETWRRDLPWDDTLPSDLMKKFLDWYKELTYLNDCRIPRRLTAENLKERTENWSDLASRGCTARTLRDCRWWEGPAWLRLAPDQWPSADVSVDECEVQAETKRTVCSTQVCVNDILLEKIQSYFSKYTKIIRTVAWILRVIHNMKNSTNKKRGEITFNEYSRAEKTVIKLIQKGSNEYMGKEGKNLNKFTDTEGLIKIRTKLTLSDFPELTRSPYLLPAKHPVRGKENKDKIKVGDIVLVETTDKRIRWPLGVVQNLLTGKDGIARTAEIKTALGTKIRPVQRLFRLEVSSELTGNKSPVISQRPDSPNDVQPAESPAETSVPNSVPQSSRCGRQVKIPSKFNIYHRY
ncbi:pao retrotransposon peptidase domain-containing protein [Phthorimaea operculella]|nr:pao retrotransposon peptidase domain-containing protein [Phthorimaea operculella]